MRLVFLPRSVSLNATKLLFLKGLLCVLFLSLFSTNSQALTVNFTTNPAAVNGVITICKNQSITYTNSSLGTTPSSVYNWTFQGGTPGTANTIGPHTVTYATAGNYTTTLAIGALTKTVSVVVLNSIGYNASLIIDPAYTSFGYSSTVNASNQTVFRYCGSTPNYSSNVLFGFELPVYPTTVAITVNWGDGNTSTYTGGTLNVA